MPGYLQESRLKNYTFKPVERETGQLLGKSVRFLSEAWSIPSTRTEGQSVIPRE
jgi:hypothetical protein